jgi:hypothetical protein
LTIAQLEASDVLRADDAEMASVQCADTACAESLGSGDEAAVDAAEVLIGVLNGERCDSSPIGCRERLERISPAAADSYNAASAAAPSCRSISHPVVERR